MAVYTPTRLGTSPVFLTNSGADYYTVPSGKSAVVKQIVFNNSSTSAVTVTVHLLRVSASAATSNQIISQLSVGPKSQVIWAADLPMVTAEKIHALASASDAVTFTMTGIEIA